MKKMLAFAVVGGDMRQVKMAEMIAEDGYAVKIFAMGNSTEISEKLIIANSVEEAVSDADCLILPLPVSDDNKRLNTPLVNEDYELEDVIKSCPPGLIICAGRVSDEVSRTAKELGFIIHDYFKREELAIFNAVPTAEGAIQIAMEELPVTIHNLNCLVIGFGRLGKILANRLKGLGAKVTVSARSFKDIAWIQAMGMEAENTLRLEGRLGEYDLIINTVPACILNKKRLSEVKKKCLCIDLASKPGGMDFTAASELGIKAIWALSLPGKVAPVTSGCIIKDTVYNILDELVGFR